MLFYPGAWLVSARAGSKTPRLKVGCSFLGYIILHILGMITKYILHILSWYILYTIKFGDNFYPLYIDIYLRSSEGVDPKEEVAGTPDAGGFLIRKIWYLHSCLMQWEWWHTVGVNFCRVSLQIWILFELGKASRHCDKAYHPDFLLAKMDPQLG